MIRKLAVCTVLMLSAEVLASGSSGVVHIANVHQRECSGDKDFEITLTGSHQNPDRCSNNTVVNFSCSHQNIDTVRSLALTSMVADKKVSFWLNGCDAQGHARGSTIQLFK